MLQSKSMCWNVCGVIPSQSLESVFIKWNRNFSYIKKKILVNIKSVYFTSQCKCVCRVTLPTTDEDKHSCNFPANNMCYRSMIDTTERDYNLFGHNKIHPIIPVEAVPSIQKFTFTN